jgi:hypothetical protein
MLHARIPENFFDFGTTGLNGDACELILNKMDDAVCGRFLGSPIVGYEFSETTAAHEVRTYEKLEQLIKHVIKDPGHQYNTLCHYKAMIMLHDVSDVIKEVIVASVETDPVLKKQCAVELKNYDLTVTPFVYQLALTATAQKSKALFNDTIDHLRFELLAGDQHGRGFTMEESIEFCNKSVTTIQETSRLFRGFSNWKEPQMVHETRVMMAYYNEIEQTTSFAGMHSQIHEKADGTAYACGISHFKNDNGLTPTHYHCRSVVQNRINGRYEKNLANLIERAGNNPQQLALALCSLQHCYNISQTTYALGKPHISLQELVDEPDEHHAHDIHLQFAAQRKELFQKGDATIIESKTLVDLYGNAIHSMVQDGICLVPEAGKTLAESKAITRLTLDDRTRNTLAGYAPLLSL